MRSRQRNKGDWEQQVGHWDLERQQPRKGARNQWDKEGRGASGLKRLRWVANAYGRRLSELRRVARATYPEEGTRPRSNPEMVQKREGHGELKVEELWSEMVEVIVIV